MPKSAKKHYYAYFVPGDSRGVVEGWAACEKKVTGVPGARYRGFSTKAEAETWLQAGAAYEMRPPRERTKLVPGIYFDAGTGRGDGVESSVTDEKGNNLLALILPESKINQFGKYRIPGDVTNNYGELLACRYALQVARKLGARHVFGDSKLVIEYWSRGVFKEDELPEKTAMLIREVADLREEFESRGGTIGRVPGADNPADLGFHVL